MRKTLTMLLAALTLAATLPVTTSCARRTAQQKKTASYKRKARGGHTPCPCDSH
ncbi:hypothetical protein [Hymenobacter sp. CRA2]|uniref:hypothetical protein n=1 Tax=Hymenobacter sp. CRA2 TaxID=1955620 RepID=UPI0015907E50|nr:hypothetical protein [Hymenobacter sp. CRA2]